MRLWDVWSLMKLTDCYDKESNAAHFDDPTGGTETTFQTT